MLKLRDMHGKNMASSKNYPITRLYERWEYALRVNGEACLVSVGIDNDSERLGSKLVEKS